MEEKPVGVRLDPSSLGQEALTEIATTPLQIC